MTQPLSPRNPNQSRHSGAPADAAGRPIQINQIVAGDDPVLLVNEAQRLAARLNDTSDTTMTQVRRLFSTFRQIEFAWPQHPGQDAAREKEADAAYFELILMKPKLQYQAAKHKSLQQLTQTIETGIDAVGKDRARLDRLMQFFEATVAYYTAEAAKRSTG